MFYHKINIFTILVILYAIITGCATTYAPADGLPDTDEVPKYEFGGWITVITEPDSSNHDEKWMQYSGEFISYDEANIYLLYDSLYQIPKNKIRNSILELDEKNSAVFGLWVMGGTISTISNGKFLILTAPLWLLTGIPTAVGESARDRYESDAPAEKYWNSINKFARFPQGIKNIDLSSIKPIFNYQK